MLLDLTLPINIKTKEKAEKNEKIVAYGHLGTHFDIMDKEFPLEYVERDAIAFNVSAITDREIEADDINMELVNEGMFVGFYSNFIEKYDYGTKEYFAKHPELSKSLIAKLLEKKVSVIGIDFAGVRRDVEHTETDQYCANHGVFIVENLCNMKKLLGVEKSIQFKANTYPLNYKGLTGIPCRVVAKV
ncbi:cyclase family protein [Oceanirhabdus seepicola]|uniref:Cyclase family protein n=1 Tax=Oceanirhabdus seepicola TaxID=2828781 RepID=A0A9J6NXR0_9CLOT|nr:cyclase family protein [Oceanirhabdus seepicola]MCM1988844.1 cyclase family protein [Oceanirhabdus seepicola]